jgi:hypothetical protein
MICNTVEQKKPSRMNVQSTPEKIHLSNLALDVNRHERDEIFNRLIHTYIMDTLESDATEVYPCGDAVDRVFDVFHSTLHIRTLERIKQHSP